MLLMKWLAWLTRTEGVRTKVSDFKSSFLPESSTGIWALNRRKPILMYGKHFSSSAIN